jgi:two-component system sensor kinase FixL
MDFSPKSASSPSVTEGSGCPVVHVASDSKNVDDEPGSRLRQLVETCRDSVMFIDRYGTIKLANPATFSMFGYEQDELIGADVRMLMSEPYASNHQAYIEHYERTGERKAIGHIRQVSARRKNGEEFSIELSVTKLSELGDGARYGAFIRDVSDRVRLQGELMHRERAVTVGTTASMLVHEIGNPLNNMALQLQALRRRLNKLDGGAATVEKVDACAQEIDRLSRLVQEFRALSGRRRIVRRPLHLTRLVESVLANLMRLSGGISVSREFRDDNAEVLADSDKIQQVFLNLFHNAMDAMPQGGTLTLRTQRSEKEYVLEVADTGVGIPAGLDVFEPFVTTKADGTGLGLAICGEIVREHEGTLNFESVPGQGTIFRLRVPLSTREIKPRKAF